MPARRLRALLDQVARDRVLLRLHRVVHGAPAARIAQRWIKACSHQALGLCDATPACRIEKCRVPERVHRRNVRFRLQQHFQGVRTLGRRGQHQGRDSLRVDRIDSGIVCNQPAHRSRSARLGRVMQYRTMECVVGVLWQERPERGQRVDITAARSRDCHRQGHCGLGCKDTRIHLQWQLACLQQARRLGVPGRSGLGEPGPRRRFVDGRVVRCKCCQGIRRARLTLGCRGREERPRTLGILVDPEPGQVQGAQQVLRARISSERVGGKTSSRIRELLETQRALGRLEQVRRGEHRWNGRNRRHRPGCADHAEERSGYRGDTSNSRVMPSHTSSPRESPLGAGNPTAGYPRH